MLNLISEINQAAFRDFGEATGFLVDQAKRAGVKHLSYWYLQYVDDAPDQVIWVATYDPDYMNYYMNKFTPVSDPVISSVMNGKYVDWSEWFSTDEVAQTVNAVAKQYGLTKYGISMPLDAPGEDKIIFSVCMDSTDEKWPHHRKELAQRFGHFAAEFDRRMQPLIRAGFKGSSTFRLFA